MVSARNEQAIFVLCLELVCLHSEEQIRHTGLLPFLIISCDEEKRKKKSVQIFQGKKLFLFPSALNVAHHVIVMGCVQYMRVTWVCLGIRGTMFYIKQIIGIKYKKSRGSKGRFIMVSGNVLVKIYVLLNLKRKKERLSMGNCWFIGVNKSSLHHRFRCPLQLSFTLHKPSRTIPEK